MVHDNYINNISQYAHDHYIIKIQTIKQKIQTSATELQKSPGTKVNSAQMLSIADDLLQAKIAACMYGDSHDEIHKANVKKFMKLELLNKIPTHFENYQMIQDALKSGWITQNQIQAIKDLKKIDIDSKSSPHQLHETIDKAITDFSSACDGLFNAMDQLNKMLSQQPQKTQPTNQKIYNAVAEATVVASEVKKTSDPTYWYIQRRMSDKEKTTVLLIQLQIEKAGDIRYFGFNMQKTARIVVQKNNKKYTGLIDPANQVIACSNYTIERLSNDEKLKDMVASEEYTQMNLHDNAIILYFKNVQQLQEKIIHKKLS